MATTTISPSRIVLAIVMAVIAGLLAYRAYDDAHFAHLRATDTSAANKVRPTDGTALAKALEARLQSQSDTPFTIDDLKAGLVGTPLSRGLLRLVAIKAEAGGDSAKADKAMGLSNAISRRDAVTQLWLIERSVQNQDMAGALRHYHAALAVHPELGPVLFPILTKALSFPEVRKALAPYIARQTRWSAGFLNFAVTQGNPVDVAQLVMPIGNSLRGGSYEATHAKLLARLVERGDFAIATNVAQVVIPQFKKMTLTSFAIDESTTDKRLGALAWSLAEGKGILASTNGAGGVDIDIDPLSRGIVALRTMAVLAGRDYKLSQTIRGGESGSADMSLDWQGLCVSSQETRVIWQQKLPIQRRMQRLESTISVPADCKGVQFVLSARGPDAQQAGNVGLENLDLRLADN